MCSSLQPIYLLADAQLLFWRNDGGLFIDSLRRLKKQEHLRAAYIGASNDDDPAFYSIFESAMKSLRVDDARMISSSLPAEERSFICQADIILLAGGDVERGWRVFEENGLKRLIPQRYSEGALLVGVSAGAVQLGLLGWPAKQVSPDDLFETFKLVPFIISAHDEGTEWEELQSVMRLKGGSARGLGLPAGGGAIYHPDHSLEPVRHPLIEFSLRDETVKQDLLVPGIATPLEVSRPQRVAEIKRQPPA